MPFEKLDPQPPLREEALLDGDPRDAAAPYNRRAPGLYPGERAYRLEDGHLVAASIEQKWLDNNAGIAFTACARWIDADGATHLCAKGQHIEATYPHTEALPNIDQFGAAAIAGDVLRAVLGEPPDLLREVPVEGGEPLATPVVALDAGVKLNASIRAAIASAAGLAAFGDVDALLGMAAPAGGARADT